MRSTKTLLLHLTLISICAFSVGCKETQNIASKPKTTIDKIREIYSGYYSFVNKRDVKIQIRPLSKFIEYLPNGKVLTAEEVKNTCPNCPEVTGVFDGFDYGVNEPQGLILYINLGGKDLELRAGLMERAKSEAHQNVLGIKNEIAELAFSANYSSKPESLFIPKIVTLIINKSFKEMLGKVPKKHQEFTHEYKISIGGLSNDQIRSYHLSFNSGTKTVNISSLLVRAIYIHSINSNYRGFLNFENKYLNDPQARRALTEADLNSYLNNLSESFSDNLQWLFSQQLAKIYLSENGQNEVSDLASDCFGAIPIIQSDDYLEGGFLEFLLMETDTEEETKLWQISGSSLTEHRITQLNKLKELETPIENTYCN